MEGGQLKNVTMQFLIYALRYIYEGTGVVTPFSLLWLPLGDLQCICSLLHISSGELPFELSTIVKISQFPDSTWHVAAMSVLFLLLGLGKNVRTVWQGA